MKHQLNAEGYYPVKIRIYYNNTISYAPTNLKVSARQLSRSGDIRDRQVLRICDDIIERYEEIVKDNYFLVETFSTANELRDYLIKKTRKIELNFFAIAENIIAQRDADGHVQTAINMRRSLSVFKDFFRVRALDITSISQRDIVNFMKFLQSERQIARRDQFGRLTITSRPGVTADTAKAYAVDLRTIFNEARRDYNADELVIKNQPFANIDLSRHLKTGIKTVSAAVIARIFSYHPSDSLEELAQQVFCISFCLCGTNCIDLYNMPPLVDGRAEFCRTKTAGRRHDHAFISIALPDVAMRFVNEVASRDSHHAFNFHSRYSNHRTFCRAVNDGLKKIAAAISEPTLSTYYARHSWASIARNDCNVDVADINLSLNHVQQDRMTDVYIKKDWSRIDRANDSVLKIVLGASRQN